MDELGPLADATVEALGLAAADLFVMSVPASLSALRTLCELDEHKLSAAGVLNADGEIIANCSVSDLRDVPCDKYGLLVRAGSLRARFTHALHVNSRKSRRCQCWSSWLCRLAAKSRAAR